MKDVISNLLQKTMQKTFNLKLIAKESNKKLKKGWKIIKKFENSLK